VIGGGVNDEMLRFFLRVYFTVKKKPELLTEAVTLPDGSVFKFDDLSSSSPSRNNSGYSPRDYATRLKDLIPDFDSVKWYYICSKTSYNRIALRHPVSDKAIGQTIRLELIPYRHSCRPNAVINFWPNCETEVRAISDISVGEEITVSKLPSHFLLAPKKQRTEYLKAVSSRTFECDCPRCSKASRKDDAILQQINDNSLEAEGIFGRSGYFKDVFDLDDKCVQMLKQVFGEYSTHASNLLMGSLKLRVYAALATKDIESLKPFLKNLADCISISHGEAHPVFKKFHKMLLPLTCPGCAAEMAAKYSRPRKTKTKKATEGMGFCEEEEEAMEDTTGGDSKVVVVKSSKVVMNSTLNAESIRDFVACLKNSGPQTLMQMVQEGIFAK
jgi:hypothetical protein